MDKEKFAEFERIKASGLTNMFNVKNVVTLSNGILTGREVMDIISRYSQYREEFKNE